MNNSFEQQIDLAIEKILESKNIFIVSHVQPDGDNIGSILALGLALKKIDKNIVVLKSDTIPSDYLFLPNVDIIQDYSDKLEIDLLITLDSSDEDRLGKNKVLLEHAKTIINIDHHISNTNFGHINIVDSTAAATGELVYKIINRMNISIDKDIGTCIYTAISSDTGSFMYDNTTSETHEIISELLKLGIDKSNININLYQNRSIERTMLFIKALETLNLYFDNKVAVVKVTNKILEDSGSKMEDTEGIVSFIREIRDVEIAILLKEFNENEIKISMRSKKNVDVAAICHNFGGGGHVKAAGCTINSSMDTSEELILNEIKKII